MHDAQDVAIVLGRITAKGRKAKDRFDAREKVESVADMLGIDNMATSYSVPSNFLDGTVDEGLWMPVGTILNYTDWLVKEGYVFIHNKGLVLGESDGDSAGTVYICLNRKAEPYFMYVDTNCWLQFIAGNWPGDAGTGSPINFQPFSVATTDTWQSAVSGTRSVASKINDIRGLRCGP